MAWGEQNTQEKGFAQMGAAIEAGINFFDTTKMYAVPPTARSHGSTETITGNWRPTSAFAKKPCRPPRSAGTPILAGSSPCMWGTRYWRRPWLLPYCLHVVNAVAVGKSPTPAWGMFCIACTMEVASILGIHSSPSSNSSVPSLICPCRLCRATCPPLRNELTTVHRHARGERNRLNQPGLLRFQQRSCCANHGNAGE